MRPRHHPSEALLVDYAAGSLEVSRELVVSAHLAACATCAKSLELLDAVGGALLKDIEPTAVATDALSAVMARIEQPERSRPSTLPPYPDWIRVPSAVLEAARRRRRWVAPGVWVAPVIGSRNGPRAYLLRVGAGMAVPSHTHRNDELVVVLKGSYADDGELHDRADFSENSGDLVHKPRATLDGECICLIAAEGSLVARDWVGRLFQPFAGI